MWIVRYHVRYLPGLRLKTVREPHDIPRVERRVPRGGRAVGTWRLTLVNRIRAVRARKDPVCNFGSPKIGGCPHRAHF